MENRWDSMYILCIESIDGLKEGNFYDVCGQGDLSFIVNSNKQGWGLCIEY